MIGRFITRLVDMQAGWARPFGDFNHRWLSALFRPIVPIKDLLHGTWLGHPLHSALTDVPVGSLTIAVILDLIGQPAARCRRGRSSTAASSARGTARGSGWQTGTSPAGPRCTTSRPTRAAERTPAGRCVAR